MNAVEIEEAISALAAEPFDGQEFPFAFLAAFGNKETAIKRLRAGAANTSDIPGAVLQRSHIHLATCEPGKTREMLAALKASPRTAKGKVKFILATDGDVVEAEELSTEEPLACPYTELAEHFGFFLPLAGISTVAEIKDNPIDIKATGRLNKLYMQLLSDNPDWDCDAKRPALNQFMARLIFCFFAEDTDIFLGDNLFSACLRQMTDPQSTNTHEVIKELFRAMNLPPAARKAAKVKSWADAFPYVNGGLFSNDIDCPIFSKIARSYLLRIGDLDWKRINPDIFGSMIQAVADDEERGSLGMHYTSVPNILKVLDPLFLDDLREQLEEAADNARKLLNLRKRIAAIRVFDPACGSGNFLVIAYIKLREIEAEIIRRRKDDDKKSWIKLTNFYGIEIKSFPAEIARLALLIAEFQCNVRFIGQIEARLDVLPLHDTGRIVTGNALRLDWLEVCPRPASMNAAEQDLGGSTGRLAIDPIPTNETFICGNPPYKGNSQQNSAQKSDMMAALGAKLSGWKTLDYICGWFIKASEYSRHGTSSFAFVSTNSICQGQQVPVLWPALFGAGLSITFAHTSFKWQNLAKHNAGVTVVVIGLSKSWSGTNRLFSIDQHGQSALREVENINGYLVSSRNIVVERRASTPTDRFEMLRGNMPYDGGNLLLSAEELAQLKLSVPNRDKFIRRIFGSAEFIRGLERYCVWIEDRNFPEAVMVADFASRIKNVQKMRTASTDPGANALASAPYRFREMNVAKRHTLAMPRVSSENREYLPIGLLPERAVLSDLAYGLYDAPLWNMALIASRLHLVWIATVCGKMKTDFRYSNTLGWNTFPVPPLTENQKAELTRCAEDILLAREAHFPDTIADLYDPEAMPADLRAAHDRNDETLERIYIGRRFKNDTERLEKLFDMYTKMIKDEDAKAPAKASRKPKSAPEEGSAA